jgi:hypothetical protein
VTKLLCPCDEGSLTRNLNIVIAGEESVPKGNVQSDEDSSAAQSAKMGKDEGTQTGGANQATLEKDTQKIDRPPRQNPTTG